MSSWCFDHSIEFTRRNFNYNCNHPHSMIHHYPTIILKITCQCLIHTLKIASFFVFLLAPGFLSYTAITSLIVLILIYKVTPIYGEKQPMVFISICSLVGSFLVISTQGTSWYDKSCLIYLIHHLFIIFHNHLFKIVYYYNVYHLFKDLDLQSFTHFQTGTMTINSYIGNYTLFYPSLLQQLSYKSII